MNILYVSDLTTHGSTLYRLWALERLGHRIIPLNSANYRSRNSIIRRLAHRIAAGPGVNRLNRDILKMAEREKPDVVWADKVLSMQPATLERLRTMGIVTLSYMMDNPFGPRHDPGWRLYVKNIQHYDLNVVPREKSIADYVARGCRNVIKIQFAYEPTIHYPPPAGWSDTDRDRAVSFIGTPYDNRAEFLTRLWKEFGFPVSVSGGLVWKSALGREAAAAIYRGNGELFGDDYREGIWKSRINLSFITHSNEDEFAHKSFEIAGAGGFLLAERSAGHLQYFKEDAEAVFFSTIEECAEKIRRYLPDEDARQRIAAAGYERAVGGGYHNDRQMGLVVERVQAIVENTRGTPAGRR